MLSTSVEIHLTLNFVHLSLNLAVQQGSAESKSRGQQPLRRRSRRAKSVDALSLGRPNGNQPAQFGHFRSFDIDA